MTFKIVIIKFNKLRDGLELELDDNIKTISLSGHIQFFFYSYNLLILED